MHLQRQTLIHAPWTASQADQWENNVTHLTNLHAGNCSAWGHSDVLMLITDMWQSLTPLNHVKWSASASQEEGHDNYDDHGSQQVGYIQYHVLKALKFAELYKKH